MTVQPEMLTFSVNDFRTCSNNEFFVMRKFSTVHAQKLQVALDVRTLKLFPQLINFLGKAECTQKKKILNKFFNAQMRTLRLKTWCI